MCKKHLGLFCFDVFAQVTQSLVCLHILFSKFFYESI